VCLGSWVSGQGAPKQNLWMGECCGPRLIINDVYTYIYVQYSKPLCEYTPIKFDLLPIFPFSICVTNNQYCSHNKAFISSYATVTKSYIRPNGLYSVCQTYRISWALLITNVFFKMASMFFRFFVN